MLDVHRKFRVVATSAPLSSDERKRRVLILCLNFAKNLETYRVGFSALKGKQELFWGDATNNCVDVAVLEWCKLFGDFNGEHHWKKVISQENASSFERELLAHLSMSGAKFSEVVAHMRAYRDKFVAHLDEQRVMIIPVLETPMKAVQFLHAFIVTHEIAEDKVADLFPAPEDFEKARISHRALVASIFDSRSGVK